MKDYRVLTTHELQNMWEHLRDKVLDKGSITQKEKDELYAMRMELEKRKGEKKPTVNINFTDYLTE